LIEGSVSKVAGSDKPIFSKLKADYDACMDAISISNAGLKPLKEITQKVKELMDKHEPILPGTRSSFQVSTAASTVAVESLTDTLAYLIEAGVPALVDFYVSVCMYLPFS
jgi:hypothetical protein